MRRFFKRPESESVSGREPGATGKAAATPAVGLSRAERRRRSKRAIARRRAVDLALAEERLESRIAMAVNVAGYEDAVDFFIPPRIEFDDSGSGYRLAPHSPQHFVHGRAVVASDDGDDVYIRQVASVTQDLIVSSTSNFLNYKIVDSIDEMYQQIVVTNGTERIEANAIRADFDPNQVDAARPFPTRFMLTSEEVTLQNNQPSLVAPGNNGAVRIQYLQSDGTVSTWEWTAAAVAAGGAPTRATPASVGHIQPVSIGFNSVNLDGIADFDIGQSYIDVFWAGVPSIDRPPQLTASYTTTDITPGIDLGIGGTVTETVRPTERYAPNGLIQTLTFTMPGALATLQDGIANRQSLGIIPGTFRGNAGTISVTWSDGVLYPLPAFRADVDGVLRFTPTPTDVPDLPLDYNESLYGNSSTFFLPSNGTHRRPWHNLDSWCPHAGVQEVAGCGG